MPAPQPGELMDVRGLMSLTGRRALVTGAAGEVGALACHTLAGLGADLVITDLPSPRLDELRERLTQQYEVTVRAVACDLESEASRTELIEAVTEQPLAVLVNNAAFVGTSQLQGWAVPFEQQALTAWRRALEVNLTAAFHLCQGLCPALTASGAGSVINVGSIYGLVGPDWSLYEGTEMANPAAYAASKGGLHQLTRWMATTLGPHVRVNAIAPGGIARSQPEQFVARYSSRTPLARMAEPSDMQGTIAYLACDLSSYVTGQIIAVDGGWTAW